MLHNSDLLQIDAGITDGNLHTSAKVSGVGWGGVGWGGVGREGVILAVSTVPERNRQE